MRDTPILVLGAGSWGTALAILLARNGRSVLLWGHRAEHVARLGAERCNQRYLPGAVFPDGLRVTADLEGALTAVRDVVVAVPLKALREVLVRVAARRPADLRLLWSCKGIEPGRQRLVHEVVEEVLGTDSEYGVLSGPTFAAETVAGHPTAAVIASASAELARDFVGGFHGGAFRVYTAGDVIGVEVAGAVKNVIAIAAGIADGLGLGANTRAAVVTRGLSEITRLGLALGGRAPTFMGLAGLGDLVLSCTDDQSRNRRLGLALGRGRSPEAATAVIGQAVEGAGTAAEVDVLAVRTGVELPICAQVAALLRGDTTAEKAVHALLAREPTRESPADV